MDTSIEDIVARLRANLQSKAPPAQTLQEWHAAGGGIPTQYRDKPDEWHAKVRHLTSKQEPHMAGGGLLEKLASVGSKAITGSKAARNAAREAQLAAELMDVPTQAGAIITPATAAQRAAAGRSAAKVIAASPPSRMSEALGNLNVEGKGKLSTTQADRTRVGGGNIGGAAFPAISEADPLYAGKVWGVMDKPIASRLTSLSDPNTVWSTMLGSATQLKTNPIVFDKLKKAFQGAVKEGKLSPELLAKYNHNLALTFGEGANVLDPQLWKQADTFEKRGALAEVLMGTGKPPKEGGISLGGEQRGGSIIPGTDILKAETEPSLMHTAHGGDSPTYAVGPRLFSLNGETEYRPDLHPGFPTLLGGKDYGYNIKPVPTEIALPDWHERFKLANPKRDAGYYDLSLGVKGEGLPSQDINETYLKFLQSQGYKDGGEVHMKDGGFREQDTVSATPRNAPLGFIADVFQGAQDALSNPNRKPRLMESITSALLGVEPIARTADRLSYGEPLTSGSGQTLRPLDDTTDAFLTVAPLAGPLARAGGKGAKTTAKFLAPKAGAMLDDYVMSTGLALPVMKPKGGNWLDGQSERITEPLKLLEAPRYTHVNDQGFSVAPEYGRPMTAEELATISDNFGFEKNKIFNTWIDKKLNPYVRNEMGTPEDPLRLMAEQYAIDKPELLAQADAKLAKLNAKTLELMQERGVPAEYLTRHRQDIIAAEKARDLIEARQALHTQVPEGGRWEPEHLAAKRVGAGFPAKGMGVSEEAKNWEQISDEAIGMQPAGDRIGRGYVTETTGINTWLNKVPPETPTYTGYGTNELNFEHLGDELRNALDPESGLPINLRLNYDELPKKTVPDIVSRVADINAWRATQKAEADIALANNAAAVVVKEYPQQGLAWKQIKLPDMPEVLPEGWSEPVTKAGTLVSQSADGTKVLGKDLPDLIKNIYHRHPETPGNPKTILEDALRYEGDIMNHCVGGYCPDVAQGRSLIYTLRDAQGKSHATIEVKPSKTLTPEKREAQMGHLVNRLLGEGMSEEKALKEANKLYPESETAPSIEQIKGLNNKAPAKEYQSQIQDFVKSGNWSDVGDLENTGLYKLDKDFLGDAAKRIPTGETSGMFLPQERQELIIKAIEAKLLPERGYITKEEYENALKAVAPDEGMARGGLARMQQYKGIR